MLKKVMVVVLLACVGLTAGVAFGTLFSGNEIPAPDVLYVQSSCHNDWHPLASHLVPNIRAHHTYVNAPGLGGCVVQLPVRISNPSGGLPMGDYVLFGLLGGLSAALGFLVPPRSSLSAITF